MINKISELAKTNLKISDFHLREGSNIAYRVLGEIFQDTNSLIKKSKLCMKNKEVFNRENEKITLSLQ
jgi:Tfp pilus assembly pilus retraction ATPase PilT